MVTSLSSDFLPSSWDYYRPTLIDILTLAGSFGVQRLQPQFPGADRDAKAELERLGGKAP